MARPRKQKYDPRQLSFMFDLMTDQIDSIREENERADRQEEISPPLKASTAVQRAYDHVQPDSLLPYVRLGMNSKGMTVYALQAGGRMISRNPAIMQTADGDKDSPDNLYSKGKHHYLTVEEVAAFRKSSTQTVQTSEVQYGARQTNGSVGNRPQSSQARNDRGSEKRGVHQFSLFDFGQVGIEQPGPVESSGSDSGRGGTASAAGPATDSGETRPDQRIGQASPTPGHERLGDIGNGRDRHETGRNGSIESLVSDDEAGTVSLADTVPVRAGFIKENYRITPDDQLGVGGAKAKFADNIAAIRLLKQLQEAGAEQAGPEEKKILVRYVGWGGLPQAFDPENEKWTAEYQELRNILTPDEYAKARRSTQDAHFTSETVIKGIYEGLSALGLNTGTKLHILEPSAGIGNFMGLCPDDLNAKFVAVELDPTTAAISQYLYPEARHINNGFQNASFSASRFDAVVGNPPFGNQALFDPEFPELKKFSIHNYFIAKSLNLLREGGVGAFVVSRFFLDAADPSVREHISQYADFLGAVRLPETAFRQNALTDVTTDIVFFQKHDGKNKRNADWVRTAAITAEDQKNGGTRPATVNSYFADNPGQVIGKMAYSGGMFRDALNCVADTPLMDLGQEISKRLDALPGNVFVPKLDFAESTSSASLNTEFLASDYFRSLKTGALCVEPTSGKIVFKTAGAYGDNSYDPLPVKNDTARQRLVSMIQIRDTLRELLNAEKSDAEEARIEALRGQLNRQYDAFAKRYGHLNSQTNRALMSEDPEHSLLESLEMEYDKGVSKELAKKHGGTPRPASARKAAIFRQRVLKPAQTVDRAETVKDAMIISLREAGKIDFSRMARLLGRPADVIQKDLQEQGLIFLNPANEEWEIRDKYLTGNVRGKLHRAHEAAQKDPRFIANVEALTVAMPPDIEAVDIGIKFGSTWVPQEIVDEFIENLHGGKGYQTVNYFPTLGRWEAQVRIWDTALSTNVWGIPEYPAGKIIESLLMNRPIKVEKESGQYDSNDKPIMVVDQELTAAAMQKADEVRQAFLDWVWTDDDRRDMLTRLYNERFNTHVPPHYDGSHIELVGASSDVTLRPHQKDVVWRSIQEGTALFDHVVGAGKTMACIATIMESKRMGFVSKPMVVVPNHLLHQWRDEFYKLYPGANILVADKTDFTKQNRERLFSRIATGEWDAVIVAHSSFKKIDMPRDVQEDILQEQIDAVINAIQAAKENNGGRATVKQLEKQREKMQARYEKLLAGTGAKDRSVDFGDLGVDALFVDESHEFKNLSYATSMNVSGLGNITGSAKALDLFIKCRYLQRKNDGRGVYFMTGTPISNTIAEVYTLQRYMQYEDLQAKDIEHFDAWASTFGQITNGWELDATGVNYKLKSRFASFQNVPELLSMYRTFADVVTKNDLDDQAKQAGQRPLTPPVTGGKPFNHVVERSADQAAYMDEIIHRMEHLPSDPREDNPLKITNDARKAGLDFRLTDPDAADAPGSKINAAVDRIYEIWRDTAADRGTQLVFCDLSTPKGKGVAGPAPEVSPNGSPVASLNGEAVASPDASPVAASGGQVDPLDDVDMVEVSDNDSGEDSSVANDMDAVIALSSAKFSVYDDMRQKLIARGIPSDEIAFIHDANTDIRKSKLFSDMNAGRVRVLLGSTAKMGAGMNAQKRLVAAHHLDAPWRPSDLEQRNGRIIRQGNMLYERDPENFSVGVYYYATKQTYDARMWQTIEYKAAAIEQFRKGDLLQRVIDDVQGEAATAAEMKAAASGNPLILMQVKLAGELRKLEALYSQHQRGQHRLRDRLKWLNTVDERLARAEAVYADDIGRRDANTRMVTEKGKEKIRVELLVDGKILRENDSDHMAERLRNGVKEVTRNFGKKALFGTYRGFDVYIQRHTQFGGADGFRFALQGAGDREFQPANLTYTFDEKFSLTGLFQRLDNFLAKGLDEAMETYRQNASREKAELETVTAALNKDFPQMAELAVVRENHGAVMRELQRMQDDSGYVSEWEPKSSAVEPPPTPMPAPSAPMMRCG